MYVTRFLDKLQTWLTEGLLLAILVLIFGFFLFTLFFRLHRLIDLADLLPAETTLAYGVVNTEDYRAGPRHALFDQTLTEFLGTPLTELSWFKRDVAYAWTMEGAILFLEVDSQKEAKKFLIEHQIPDSHFLFIKDLLAYGTSSALASLKDPNGVPAKPVAESDGYHNVKARLAHFQSAFVYVNLQKAQHAFLRFLSEQGISEPLFLESLYRLFPVFGASIQMGSTGWTMESFIAVDKSILGNEAYFHPSQKYDQTLLTYSQPFAFEWGGVDAAAQMQRLSEIIKKLSPGAGLIWDSTLQNTVHEFFGMSSPPERDLILTELYGLFDQEFYLGFTPGQDFLLLLELESEEEQRKILELKEQWAHNETSEIALAVLPNLALMAGSEETLIATLDRVQGRQNSRPLSDFETLLPGSDEIFILNGAFLSESSILKTLLSTFDSMNTTRKLFDDGVYSRSFFHGRTP